MIRRGGTGALAVLYAALAVGCGKGKSNAPTSATPSRHDAAAVGGARADSGRANVFTIADAAPAVAAVAGEGASAQPADLHEEERDQDPRSRDVRIRLAVSPPAEGSVMWGRKRLAELRPGKMVVEIGRPRNSGPLDLAIRARGYLPHHVRLFTDRDDKLSVRLIAPANAAGVLGYRRTRDPAAASPDGP